MDDITYEIDGTTGVITLNRPKVRNALTLAMYDEIARICSDIEPGGKLRCLIVKGAGGDAFAAGTDMTEFRGFSKPQDSLDYEAQMDRVLGAIEQCPVPVIAAITGACTGGGAAIAAACDIRICDERLKFGFPIARTLGNALSINNLARAASLLGPGRLREMLLTARLIDAQEAHSIGLVSQVLPDASAVMKRAGELAAIMAANAPKTMRASKEGLRRLLAEGPQASGDDLVIDCYMSEDFKEGIEAFLGKRTPRWKGR